MLYCDNSGLLDVTEFSIGNWQGNSPNMCLTHNIGIYWVVLQNDKEWRSLPAKFLLALQLFLLFSLVGKVQMWTLWVRLICYCVYLNWLRQIVFGMLRPAGHSWQNHLNDRHNWEDSREMLLYCRSSKIHQIFGRRWCTILGYASCS